MCLSLLIKVIVGGLGLVIRGGFVFGVLLCGVIGIFLGLL